MNTMTKHPKPLLATAPVSWGVDHIGRPNLPAWQDVFDEIAKAGFIHTELGPLGYLPQDPDLIRSEMAKRKLAVCGAALLEPLLDPAVEQRSLEAAERLMRLISGAGGRFVVIVDWVTPERSATAGRSDTAVRLTGEPLKHFHAMFEKIGRIARRQGVQAVAHPHGGTHLEFEDEIDALMAATDPELVGFAIDTGHSAFAGFDATPVYERYAARTSYINFKDCSGSVLDSVRAEKIGFLEAVDRGVFCPLGQGVVDFAGFVAAMNRNGFDGPAVIEQDRDPTAPGDPTADARSNIAFLKSIGLNADTRTTS